MDGRQFLLEVRSNLAGECLYYHLFISYSDLYEYQVIVSYHNRVSPTEEKSIGDYCRLHVDYSWTSRQLSGMVGIVFPKHVSQYFF